MPSSLRRSQRFHSADWQDELVGTETTRYCLMLSGRSSLMLSRLLFTNPVPGATEKLALIASAPFLISLRLAAALWPWTMTPWLSVQAMKFAEVARQMPRIRAMRAPARSMSELAMVAYDSRPPSCKSGTSDPFPLVDAIGWSLRKLSYQR